MTLPPDIKTHIRTVIGDALTVEMETHPVIRTLPRTFNQVLRAGIIEAFVDACETMTLPEIMALAARIGTESLLRRKPRLP